MATSWGMDGRPWILAYRIPKLRNWLSLYGEGFTEDEISPINEAPKSVWQGGLYLTKVPRVNKFDLRLEGGYTSPTRGSFCTVVLLYQRSIRERIHQ